MTEFLNDATKDILKLRAQLPDGYGASPEIQGALAWENDDDESARHAFDVADRIQAAKSALGKLAL